MNGLCSLMCPEFGYCNNRKEGQDCVGFIPMDSEEEYDEEYERIERMTY